ncbi:glucosaminidase domain-containing protein [Treponema endosymbiont of Eucomonympha sp.]|uniref:glucosaminidase domain-containing protein n=1 Tax=Treponema endosymbiont of Eucomonympha sp. TaxID=1580831 RepID=UPI000751A0E2|nr:glucosaminidase domain-containing protein [Treponema endosymbiont of Eucomonympha sp.]
MKISYYGILAFVAFALLFSCRTTRTQANQMPFRNISAFGKKTTKELTAFFLANNPTVDFVYVSQIAKYYIQEARIEGINSDVAFIQMCLETDFLRFGNLITKDMHNFCGLGATDVAHTGERFPSDRIGIRAHIQHLHAYGTTVPLKKKLVDQRYKYVKPRGKALDIFQLTGTWATDPAYGRKLDRLLTRLAQFQ